MAFWNIASLVGVQVVAVVGVVVDVDDVVDEFVDIVVDAAVDWYFCCMAATVMRDLSFMSYDSLIVELGFMIFIVMQCKLPNCSMSGRQLIPITVLC